MNTVVDQIRAEYAVDAREQVMARSKLDIPLSYDLIAPEWFTASLCQGLPGAKVVSFELGIVDNGSTNRCQFLLTYNEAGNGANLPRRVFCKGAMRLENRVMLGPPGAALCETNFYNLVRPHLKIDAPVALHAAFDPRSYAYIVIMEDLTGEVEFCTEDHSLNQGQAESMVSLLADFHATFYGDPRLNTPALPFPKWADWWAITEVADFETCCLNAFEAAHSVIPSSIYKQRHEFWPRTMASAQRHRDRPETLTHMDSHLSNWYVRPNGQMGLCDWQFVAVGSGIRDFIYAIATGLSVENRRAWEHDLLKLYLERLAANGVAPQTFDEALNDCREQLLSALGFWLYPLRPASGMPDMHSTERILKYIGRLSQAAEDLGSLDVSRGSLG